MVSADLFAPAVAPIFDVTAGPSGWIRLAEAAGPSPRVKRCWDEAILEDAGRS